jgi:transglutaminase-like putative cysteine protease
MMYFLFAQALISVPGIVSKTLRCVSLLLLLTFAVNAQDADLLKRYKARFADAPAAFTERSETVTIIVTNDTLEVYSDVLEDIIHLKNQTDLYASGRVYGSHFSQVKDLKAKTLVWEKNKFKEMHVSNFKKNSERDEGIFYDDSYNYSFDFPSVTLGNRTHLEYRTVIKDVRFLPGYIFSSYLPQNKSTYTIKTTKAVDLHYEVQNDVDGKIAFRKYEKGGFIVYEWTASDLTARKREDESPSIRYYTPHVVCYVRSFDTGKSKVNVLSGLDDLYRWYTTFVSGLNKAPSAELIKIVGDIKKNCKNDTEIAKAVFYWVQENIQYVAFEQGMRGLIPHDGSYVCEKRYGDCKDMANLIVNMLDIAGVKAYHTWIGSRDLPYQYSKIPTPLVDNHMIATYIGTDNQYYFLDATSDHTPFGFPSSMIQGKEALIGFSKTKYEIKMVPEIPKEASVITDSVVIKVQANELAGSGISTLAGYPKVFGSYALDRAKSDDAKKFVVRLLGKGTNKFYLDRYKVKGLNDRDTLTSIDYDFRVGDYFQHIGDELYINMNLNKDHYNDFINVSSRIAPKETDYKFEKREYCELIVPPGYSVEYIPADARSDGKLAGYEIKYSSSEDRVILQKRFYINYLLMVPGQFSEWNDVIRPLSEAYKESIILKKK